MKEKKKWVLGEKRLKLPYSVFMDSIKDKPKSTQERYKREWFNYRRHYPNLDHYTHIFYFECKTKYQSSYGYFETTTEHFMSYQDRRIDPDSNLALQYHSSFYPDHTVIKMRYHNTLPIAVG